MAEDVSESIKKFGSNFLENWKNKIKRVANKRLGRDIWHITKVGDEETILEEELREEKNQLLNMLNNLKEIEEMFEIVAEKFWKQATDEVWAEMGPYTPEVAARERGLLDSGTGFTGRDWSYSDDGPLHKMSDEEIKEKYGYETWPLPIKLIDGTTKVFKFPIPRGVPLRFSNGYTQIVRYYGRDAVDRTVRLYTELLKEILDVLEEQKDKIKGGDEKISTASGAKTKTQAWSDKLSAISSAFNDEISTPIEEVHKMETEYRSFLEEFATGSFGQLLSSLRTDILRYSPTTKGNVKHRRTFRVIRKIAIPIRIEGEDDPPPGEVKIDKNGDLVSIKEGEWIGDAELKIQKFIKDTLRVPKQPQNHIREFFKAGYYDKKGNLHLLENLPGWEPKKGRGLVGEEYEVGFDKYGYPLEIDEEGYVVIDKILGRKHIRRIPPEYLEQYTALLSELEIVNYVHNEWDSYRDDFRDGRYHPKSPTAVEYAMSACPVFREEFVKIINRNGKKEMVQRVPFDRIGTDTRGYMMKLANGEIIEGERSPSNLSPGLHLKFLRKKFEHPGRVYYHAWPGTAGGELGVDTASAEEGVVTTRGLSMFIIDMLTRNMKYKRELDETFEKFEAFDYGPRKFGKPFTRTPHNLQNLSDLNS